MNAAYWAKQHAVYKDKSVAELTALISENNKTLAERPELANSWINEWNEQLKAFRASKIGK